MVAPLWCGNYDWRRILRSDRAGDGIVLHVVGRICSPGSGGVGELVSGCGIWRIAHCVWISDREEARWLERFPRIASRTSTIRPLAKRHGNMRLPTRPNFRNSTDSF